MAVVLISQRLQPGSDDGSGFGNNDDGETLKMTMNAHCTFKEAQTVVDR